MADKAAEHARAQAVMGEDRPGLKAAEAARNSKRRLGKGE